MTDRQNPLNADNLDDLLTRLNAPTNDLSDVGMSALPIFGGPAVPPIQAAGYLVLVACFALAYLYAAIADRPAAPAAARSRRKPRVYRRAAMVDVYRPLGRRRGRWAAQ